MHANSAAAPADDTNTLISLTETGRATIERHWQQLENLRKGLQEWQPTDGHGAAR
jgi:DNA-binding MarR family transcriptional regulator